MTDEHETESAMGKLNLSEPDPATETTNNEDEAAEAEELSDDSNSTKSTFDGSDHEDYNTTPLTNDQLNELLLRAAALKEEGNTHFTNNELDKATRAYRRGCNALKSIHQNNNDDEQLQNLSIALHTNLSMCLFKQKKYSLAVETASKALKLNDNHVKALFRRAVAYRGMAELELAKQDLKRALQVDPKNVACKKELVAVKNEMESYKQTQQEALKKAFSGKSLYDDKETAAKMKEEKERERKKAKQELYKKRKQEWEDECVKRMASNKPAISFDEWEKEQDEMEKKRKEEQEKKRKEEEKKRREERKKLQAAKKADHSDDEDEDCELTEQELAAMRGYKRTKDGRTTSYFTRELSEDDLKAFGNTAPKRLEELGDLQSGPTRLSSSGSNLSASSSQPSKWNQAGTWEEKDTTTWCTEQLRKRLEETTIAGDKFDVDIVSVNDLTGHSSVVLASGKKRYVFEYECRLKYEIKDASQDKVVASGNVKLPDICSTSHDELEIAFDAWSTRPTSELEEDVTKARYRLVEELRAQVQSWVRDFNEAY